MVRNNELGSEAGLQPSRAAILVNAWRVVSRKELQTSGGSLSEAVAGSYRGSFAAELRRRRYFLVTDCNQISIQFGTQAVFFGTQLFGATNLGANLGAIWVPTFSRHCV